MFSKLKLLLPAVLAFWTFFALAQQAQRPATIQVDLTKKTKEPLNPIWAFFGYDEPNYTYMKDGKKIAFRISCVEPRACFCKNASSIGNRQRCEWIEMGSTNAYTEDANGKANLLLENSRQHFRYIHTAGYEAPGSIQFYA
jgi:xylan 1,4-beta-xylosidase